MKFSPSDVLESPAVRIVLIAVAIKVVYDYALNSIIPAFTTLLAMFVIAGLTAYVLSFQFKKDTHFNFFLLGAASYVAYTLGLLFLKLTDTFPVLNHEVLTIAIFGGITTLVFWAYKKMRK